MHKCGSQISWKIATENIPNKIMIYCLIEIKTSDSPFPLNAFFATSILGVIYESRYDVGNLQPTVNVSAAENG